MASLFTTLCHSLFCCLNAPYLSRRTDQEASNIRATRCRAWYQVRSIAMNHADSLDMISCGYFCRTNAVPNSLGTKTVATTTVGRTGPSLVSFAWLPQEVADMIIDLLAGDNASLRAVARTSRSCTRRAQKHLHKRIHVDFEHMSTQQLEYFPQVYESPEFRSFVREVRIDPGNIFWRLSNRNLDITLRIFRAMQRVEVLGFFDGYFPLRCDTSEVYDFVCQHYTHVTTLSMQNLFFEQMEDFLRLLRQFPQLTHLSTIGNIFARAPDADPVWYSKELGLTGSLPRLRALRMHASMAGKCEERRLLWYLALMIDPATCTAVELAVRSGRSAGVFLGKCGSHLVHIKLAELETRRRKFKQYGVAYPVADIAYSNGTALAMALEQYRTTGRRGRVQEFAGRYVVLYTQRAAERSQVAPESSVTNLVLHFRLRALQRYSYEWMGLADTLAKSSLIRVPDLRIHITVAISPDDTVVADAALLQNIQRAIAEDVASVHSTARVICSLYTDSTMRPWDDVFTRMYDSYSTGQPAARYTDAVGRPPPLPVHHIW